jgi:hypothetical protein
LEEAHQVFGRLDFAILFEDDTNARMLSISSAILSDPFEERG